MLRIYLLGDFRVERDEVPIRAGAWARRKTKALLKLVALQPKHQLHKEQAMELLWPNLDPTAARDNFYRNLSSLRHTLEPELGRPADSHFITLTSEIMRLGPAEEVWIDVEAFEKLLADARATPEPLPMLEEAIALYWGDLLPEDAYEEWAITRRDELRRAATEACFRVAGICGKQGDYERAIATLQRILAWERTDEKAHRELMLTYALAGRRHDALRQYEQCVNALRAELGVEPEAETSILYNRILRGEIAHVPAPESATLPAESAPPSSNLPEPGTPLIGREREMEEACRSLRRPEVPLLTLTGPAGIGKTRLAISVAQAMRGAFADGVAFVPLAPVRDPSLVLPAVAQALSLKEAGDFPLLDILKNYLRDKRLLLLVDNFEQVVSAAPLLAELLPTAPGLKLLVTSRELLRLTSEHDFPISPLSLPDLDRLPTLEELMDYSAIKLFTARAEASKPGFAFTAENAPAVAEICARLDGIPLAIELAAARVRMLTPQAMLARLTNRLSLLTGGARDLPARHQTLHNAIEWSYELLTPQEQTFFARLSVFARGWTEEAAEAVVTEGVGDRGSGISIGSETPTPSLTTLDRLALLLDKSLLRQVDTAGGEPRFMMLETIREYASEQLAESGESGEIRARHARYYLALAERGELEWTTAQQQHWLEWFDEEQYNLRAALAWALEEEPNEALRLGFAHWRYWLARGYLSEGRRWLEEAIARVPRHRDGTITSDRAARAKALYAAGALVTFQADYTRAEEMIAQSLGVSRSLGDKELISNSLVALSVCAYYQGDYRRAVTLQEEFLELFKELSHKRGTALVLNSLSNSVLCLGDCARASKLAEEGLVQAREAGDSLSVAASLTNLGVATFECGNPARAVVLLEESLALRRKLKDKGGMAHTLNMLGRVALAEGDIERAARLYAQSLTWRYEMMDREGMAAPIEGLAAVAAERGQPLRAARLYGAAQALRDKIGAPIPPNERAQHERIMASARSILDSESFEGAWAEGKGMSLETAVAYALADTPQVAMMPGDLPLGDAPAASIPSPTTAYPAGLTRREAEVLRLVAAGLSNAELADRLHVSVNTVESHLRAIYGKIGVTRRSAATRFALEHDLV